MRPRALRCEPPVPLVNTRGDRDAVSLEKEVIMAWSGPGAKKTCVDDELFACLDEELFNAAWYAAVAQGIESQAAVQCGHATPKPMGKVNAHIAVGLCWAIGISQTIA